MTPDPWTMTVVTGEAAHAVLMLDVPAVIDIVQRAYLAHADGEAQNPQSLFLRFPDTPGARIIALPAALDGEFAISGIKWVASYPANVTRGVPRASAVLILNRRDNGYPFAMIEASVINAARTAASAVSAAERLHPSPRRVRTVGFVGAGIIARYIFDMLAACDWQFGQILVHDLDAGSAEALAQHCREHSGTSTRVEALEPLLEASDLIVFATTSAEPYIHSPRLFRHNPTVLHISLRDLSPEIILSATNIADDVEHCLAAGTSLQLAYLAAGHKSFAAGGIADVLRGRVNIPRDRPVIFSPFGMGILDVAVGQHVYQQALARGFGIKIPNFFHDQSRWPAAAASAATS